MKVQYILGKHVFCEAEIPTPYAYPESTAFFCRHCGDIWARIWVQSRYPVWTLTHSSCEKHPAGRYDFTVVPGSFIEDAFPLATDPRAAFWPRTLDWMPREVLARELILFLNHKESVRT